MIRLQRKGGIGMGGLDVHTYVSLEEGLMGVGGQ